MTPRQRVLLIGMMGAGKSTVGRLLAERLGWPYLDSDEQVVARTGQTVPEIFARRGEAAFRAQEAAVLAAACTTDHPVVVSVAGGAVLNPENRRRIPEAGLVVWLRAPVATLAERVGEGAGRPLLGSDPAGALATIYEERLPVYAGLAEVIVDVDRCTPDEAVRRIEAELGRRAGPLPPPVDGARA